jgi:hypothetical protein
MLKPSGKPYSKSQRNRIKAAQRKLAEALERAAQALPALEAVRDEWKHPSMRIRPNEQPFRVAPEPPPPPRERIVITRRASCMMKSTGEYDPRLHRIEGEPDERPPPPKPPKPATPSFDVGERHLMRERMPPPHGGASSADSPMHHLGIWEAFNPNRKTHCVPYSPPAYSTLIPER